MRHIQNVALEMFDERGFANVTVEDVAAAAEVSPSSVYRYFHTKYGLILHDEYDDEYLRYLMVLIQDHDLIEAAALSFQALHSTEHFTLVLDATVTRVRYMLEPGPVHDAMLSLVHDIVAMLTDVVATTDGPARREPFEARVLCSALVWGVYAAAEQWYRDGATEPFLDVMLRAIQLLEPAVTRPPAAGGDTQVGQSGQSGQSGDTGEAGETDEPGDTGETGETGETGQVD